MLSFKSTFSLLFHFHQEAFPSSFSAMKMKVKLLSHVRLFVTPWAVAYQAPLSMGFSRQEYWSGWPLPSLHKGGIICISEIIDISPGNLDSSLCFIQSSISHKYSAYVKISRETISSLDMLLPLFGTSLLFHVQF